jgi:asparagine synthase (glutamine-hydrolysing)
LSHDNDKTIYENVFEFEPGQNFILNLENRDTKSWKYWDLSEVPEHREASDEDILDEFEYLIEDSVRLRFRSDREVGITLSGGIDSSIVALAAKRNRIENITAFTTKYDNHKEYDETYFAKKVAEKLDIRHLLIEPESFDLRDNEQKLTWHQELLYVSFSMLANWSIVRSIKESGTIVYLTGQGGDELFLGYERYYAAYFKHILKRSPIKALREFACASNNSKLSPLSLMSYLVYFGTNNIRNKYYKKIARDNYSEKLLNSLKDPVPNVISSNLRNLQDAEVCGQQLRRLLRYDDRISSAFGLESRPVFLDFRLVEFAYSLGYSHKINKGWTKYLLRRYLDRHGLPEIAWRKHKLGFAAPTGAWTDELVKFYGEPQIKSRIAPLLKENIRLEKLDKKDLFKIYNLYSTAINLDWELN